MNRKPVTPTVLRYLFAHSGNRCAHPDCEHILVNGDGTFVAQIAHITAAASGGPRYDPSLDDEQRRSAENLILLCYRHHRELDLDPNVTASEIREFKRLHEYRYREGSYSPSIKTLEAIALEQQSFWDNITTVNFEARREFDLVRKIDASAGFYDLCEEIRRAITRLEEISAHQYEVIKYIDQTVTPFLRDNNFVPPEDDRWELFPLGYGFFRWVWEDANLGAPNWSNHARDSLLQAEVKFAELMQLAHPEDAEITQTVQRLRKALEDTARNSSHID